VNTFSFQFAFEVYLSFKANDNIVTLTPSPHLLVLATIERFLSAGGTISAISSNESHWLQPMLVLSVHWWPTQVGVRRVLLAKELKNFAKLGQSCMKMAAVWKC
jgi:hypothetical protein